MKFIQKYIFPELLLGMLLLAPLYLSLLLAAKVLANFGQIFKPIMVLLPEAAHFRLAFACALILIFCYLLGLIVRTAVGRVWRQKLEKGLLEKIPGYAIVRGFMRRIAGKEIDNSWQPALIATDDDALMPAFVIEELPDGRYTVFVPSVPTPFAGNVFIYQRERVTLVDIPFKQAMKMISHWGQGASNWVAACPKVSS